MNTKQVSLESKDCKSRHRWYDVIVAWASGEKIQVRSNLTEWTDISNRGVPIFDSEIAEFRIKPKIVTKRYRMALVHDYSVVSVDITNSSLDDPIEYNIRGFIRWVGDIVEVEVEV